MGVGLVLGLTALSAPSARAGETTGSAGLLRSAPEVLTPLPSVPSEAKFIVPSLRSAVDAYASALQARRDVKRLRADQDEAQTQLATIASELEVLTKNRLELEQQFAALEQQQREQFEALRKELEAKLETGLVAAHQQIEAELQQNFSRQVQVFESRQQSAIDKALDQELELKERELEQLSQEIDAQTQQLIERLSRLEASPEVAKSVERSTGQALARRKAEIEARRNQLTVERGERLAQRRSEFVERLRQQQKAESDQRLKLKEASLRSAMAELLHKTQLEKTGRTSRLRQAIEDIKRRSILLAERQASLKSQEERLSQELAAKARHLEGLEAERQASLSRLEEAFQQPERLSSEALSWFGQSIRQVPSELAVELESLQERLLARAEQERRLEEQRRVLRERQQALQLSRVMESQYQQIRLKEQREAEAKARKTEELLVRANQLAERGKFDEALQIVSEAQGVGASPIKIAAAREELIRAKEQVTRQAKSAQVERLFAQAMEAFEQGRYEEAVPLFNQVIAQEAMLEQSVRLADRKAP